MNKLSRDFYTVHTSIYRDTLLSQSKALGYPQFPIDAIFITAKNYSGSGISSLYQEYSNIFQLKVSDSPTTYLGTVTMKAYNHSTASLEEVNYKTYNNPSESYLDFLETIIGSLTTFNPHFMGFLGQRVIDNATYIKCLTDSTFGGPPYQVGYLDKLLEEENKEFSNVILNNTTNG